MKKQPIVGSVHFVEYVELLFWLRESIEFLKAIDRRLDAGAMQEIRELVKRGDAVKSTRWLRERFFA